MAARNGNGKTVAKQTVKELAEAIAISTEDLIPLLAKMGLKDASPETEVPSAIAANATVAAKARSQLVLEGAKDDEVGRKLTTQEVKQVANQAGLTQALVKRLDHAIHNRECQLAFLEGFQKAQQQDQREAAIKAGEITAKLQAYQKRNTQLDEQEKALLEGQTGNDPAAIAAQLGIDLDSLLNSVKESEEAKAEARLAEEGMNPFYRLAAKHNISQ